MGALFSYGFGNDTDWRILESEDIFNLNVAGDTLLVYCLKTDNTPHFLSGFSYTPNGWLEPGLSEDEYGAENSALPEGLAVNGSVAVPYFQNYVFVGESSTATTQGELLMLYMDPTNYQGSNDVRYELPVLNDGSSDDSSSWMRRYSASFILLIALWMIRL